MDAGPERDALIEGCRPLAYHLARRLWRHYPPARRLGGVEDLEGEALLALVEAAARYDPAHAAGASLLTYAYTSVRLRLTTVARQAGLIHVPNDAWYPTGPGAAARKAAVRAAGRVGPLPAGAGADLPAGRPGSDPDRRLDVARALTHLPPRWRRLLVERFGLAGRRPRTGPDLAAELGVSKERVRQLEKKALARLRRHLGGYA